MGSDTLALPCTLGHIPHVGTRCPSLLGPFPPISSLDIESLNDSYFPDVFFSAVEKSHLARLDSPSGSR